MAAPAVIAPADWNAMFTALVQTLSLLAQAWPPPDDRGDREAHLYAQTRARLLCCVDDLQQLERARAVDIGPREATSFR